MKQLIYTRTIILIRIDGYILHQITYKKYYRNVFELINLITLHLADKVPKTANPARIHPTQSTGLQYIISKRTTLDFRLTVSRQVLTI